MKALILAAGYATRLYPLTKKFPKPLLSVAGRPLIDHIVEKLDALEEIDEVVVVTNSKFFPRFKKWARLAQTRKRLSIVDDLTRTEETKRGAIGDMYFAIRKRRIREDLLVIGGDNLFSGGLGGFLSFVHRHPGIPVIGAYDIRKKSEASSYGVIKKDRRWRIADFQEKPARPLSTLVAMCLYYFPQQKLALIGRYLKQKASKKDATGFYIDWLRRHTQVCVFVFKGRWFDIGHHKFYRQAQGAFTQ